jgi:hypothetical protein
MHSPVLEIRCVLTFERWDNTKLVTPNIELNYKRKLFINLTAAIS